MTIEKLIIKTNFYILTGGPGSGKTSVLNHLRLNGYITVAEVGRSIIKKEIEHGGNATHTGNRNEFLNKMLEYSLADFSKLLNETQIVFFDRGLPDLYGYSNEFCSKENNQVTQAVEQYKYNSKVFLFPPWKAIYQNDTERQQDYYESITTFAAIEKGYEQFKYQMVSVPLLSVEKRAEFILKNID